LWYSWPSESVWRRNPWERFTHPDIWIYIATAWLILRPHPKRLWALALVIGLVIVLAMQWINW